MPAQRFAYYPPTCLIPQDRFIWMLVSLTAALIFSLPTCLTSTLASQINIFYVSFCIINTLHPRDRLSWSRRSHFCLGNPETESLGLTSAFSKKRLVYTVKKGKRFSRPQPGGCHLPNSPWPGKVKLFPARERLVSDIPAGDGKNANLFLQCTMPHVTFLPWHPRDSFPWW
jgi:hypothetical protein